MQNATIQLSKVGCRSKHAYKHCGFTLVEILAASAIMMFIIVAVLGLTSSVLNSFNAASNQLSTNAEARQAFELLASDLESAIIKSDGNPWIEVQQENVGDLTDVAKIYFYSPVSVRPRNEYDSSGNVLQAINGDICAVSYRIIYQNPFTPASSDNRRYLFQRAIIDPEVTFSNFLGLDFTGSPPDTISGAWTASPYTDPLLDDQLVRNFNDSGEDYAELAMNMIALRVIDFEVVAVFDDGINTYSSSSKDLAPSVPMILPINATGATLPSVQGTSGTTVPVNATLKAIRISLVVLNPEGEQIIRFDPSKSTILADTSAAGETFRRNYTETFVRTIPVQVSPF